MDTTVGHKKLFCSRPFKWFEVTQVNEIGEVYVCCPSWLDTPIGNLTYQSVEETWNGKKAQEFRRSILDGSFKYCNRSRCPFLQTISEPVERVEDVKDEDLKIIIEKKLTILPYVPREIIENGNKQQVLNIQGKINNEALKDAHLLYISGSGGPFGSPFFRKWLQTMKRGDMPNLKKIHLHTNAQLWTPQMWSTIPKDIQQLVK